MTDYGYHLTPCRSGGDAKAILAGVGLLTCAVAVEWVASHAIEVLTVTTVCGVLAVAAVVALMRWGDRRERRHMAERPFLVSRTEPATLTATVIPQVTQPERPAIPQAVIFNFYGAGPMAARAFQAIPGPSEGIITKEVTPMTINATKAGKGDPILDQPCACASCTGNSNGNGK